MTRSKTISMAVGASVCLAVMGIVVNMPILNETADVQYSIEAVEDIAAEAEAMERSRIEHGEPAEATKELPAPAPVQGYAMEEPWWRWTPVATPPIEDVPTEPTVIPSTPGFWNKLDPNTVFNTIWGTLQAVIILWVTKRLRGGSNE